MLESDISTLKGIGGVRLKAFNKAGIFTLYDLVGHFPRRYEDRRGTVAVRDLVPGETCLVEGIVSSEPSVSHVRKGLSIAKLSVYDSTGVLKLTFFNQPYVRNALKKGETYRFFGRVEGNLLNPSMLNPIFEPPGRNMMLGRIVPIYPLSAGLSQSVVSKHINEVLETCPVEDWFDEYLKADLLASENLMPIKRAVRAIHCPESAEEAKAALERIAFDEMLTLMAGLALLKSRREDIKVDPFTGCDADKFFKNLPFEPTGAQRRAVAEIFSDFSSSRHMNRLLQGDVGSGKTAVAAAAIWSAVKNGRQAAFMAPTSILAGQHYNDLEPFFEKLGIKTFLLTSATGVKDKREALKSAAEEPCLIIGTHALLEDYVSFSNLGLIICDEQHRFGVSQRAGLTGKGAYPHLLAMSATPIPRTLSLVLYGDLDISVLDELPPGRQAIETYLVNESMRERIDRFIKKQVDEGRQVYIVCPMVEEGEEESPLKAAKEYALQLGERLPELRVGLVHGRLSAAKKDEVMALFAGGGLDVLVSTTVIEVGVNVPNASLMIIEDADRFGLFQLHQLRGRVGRGQHKSYCVLFYQAKNRTAIERLKAFCATNDGFKIAEEDLKTRGPGDIFGEMQHGVPTLKAAGMLMDIRVVDRAKRVAERMLEDDPGLMSESNLAFRKRVAQLFKKGRNINIFN